MKFNEIEARGQNEKRSKDRTSASTSCRRIWLAARSAVVCEASAQQIRRGCEPEMLLRLAFSTVALHRQRVDAPGSHHPAWNGGMPSRALRRPARIFKPKPVNN